MFKRFTQDEISSQTQVKSSVGRGIRANILDQYPGLEDVIEEILPKKDSMVLAKCTDHVQLLIVNKEPIFFQYRDGPWYPSLRLVHRYSECFAANTWRTDAGAIRFVLGGANIMCPGFTHADGDFSNEIALDAPVIVNAAGKRCAMCVGQVKMAKSEMATSGKGIAVDNLHFLNDGLWQLPTIS